MVSRSGLLLWLIAASIARSSAVDARPARPAPPLAAPAGAIVNVSTEAQLQSAVRTLASNTTIVIAPGTYVLTRTLYVKGVTNVGIRGATADSDDVVVVGPGMSQANYGDVPFGIWAGDGVNGITIANLTIRDLYFHPIIFNAGAENPHIYNVHLIDAGEQFVKVNPDDLGGGVDNGILEYSVIEFTTTGRSDYPKGVDIQTARNWIVRHNLFRNLLPPSGPLSGPAVLVWRGSTNTTVEGNTFVNCTRGVMLGADDYYSPSHRGGVIRNNVIFRSAGQAGDVGIMVTSSPDTQILNNTVYLSGTYPSPIEYRYETTSNVLIANNLVDGAITARDGATATLWTNLQGAGPGNFANVAGGDLHLSGLATEAIDQGTTVAAVVDWDGEGRPQGSAYDIGADERAASTVTDPANGGHPFGVIDTPTDLATVAGEVAVTGWAVDDDGIAGIDVYRSPLAGEPTAPNGLVFIGTATQVDGARPDIAEGYPTYPGVTRAGWGLMVLSNFLPNAGNGIVTVRAIARAVDGESVEIGGRTIITSNTNSALPFGTIDTPGQGGTVSGLVTNFGWALTPSPKMIDADGSAIDVYIDGVLVGHPSYGHYRADIATLFPGYANSNGAVGFYQFDSTTLANGLHTIGWAVRDNAGALQGIGSRYFRVQNP